MIKRIQELVTSLHDLLGSDYQITYDKRFGEIIVTSEPDNLSSYIVWNVKSDEDRYLYDVVLYTVADTPGDDDVKQLVGKADTADSTVRIIKKHLSQVVDDGI